MMTEKDFQMDEKILPQTKLQCFQKLNSQWLLIVLCQFCFNPTHIDGQANAHAHNDYTKESPFYSATFHGFKSIEVDIFMIDDVIYVAHNKEDIRDSLTFQKIYINPIIKNIDQLIDIQLLIDIKVFSEELLVILNKEVQKIKEHVNSKNSSVQKKITIILSGDIDKPYIVNNHFPLFYLDGRPSDLSKGHILKHCKLISDDFENYSKYQGIGNPSRKEIIKLNEVIKNIHEAGLPVRFWNTRNHINVWRLLDSMNVDYISVDDYLNYSNYLNRKPWDFSNNLSDH